MRTGIRRRTALAVLAALCLLPFAPFPASAVGPPTAAATMTTHRSATPGCVDARFAVTLSPTATQGYHVVGRLCGANHQVVQVLLAGATESGLAYWDFPRRDFYEDDPLRWAAVRDQYSYAKYLADAGATSLTLDRIGTGFSDKPPAGDVTIDANAYVVHQVIQALRHGGAGVGPFAQVITVGRSLAGAITYVESVNYHDVDGIVTQSYAETKQPAFAIFPDSFEPAQAEPRLQNNPVGYITTRPGTRQSLFFTPNADPAVVAHDEATKETITAGEIPTFVATFLPNMETARQATVPVLSVLGDQDAFWCNSAGCPEAAMEAPFFANAACFESHVVSGVGHDMNLEPSAKSAVFPLLANWVAANFGPGKRPC